MGNKRDSLRKCKFTVYNHYIPGSSPWEYKDTDFEGYFHVWIQTTEYGKPITLALVEDEDMNLYKVKYIKFLEQ